MPLKASAMILIGLHERPAGSKATLPLPPGGALSIVLLTIGLVCLQPTSTHAQQPADPGLPAVAIQGEPLGVGRIDLPASFSDALIPDRPVEVRSPDGRVFYAASQQLLQRAREPGREERRSLRRRPLRRTLERLSTALQNLNVEPEQRVAGRRVWFLFRGPMPLTVQLAGETGKPIRLTPVTDPERLRDERQGWWEAYTAAQIEAIEQQDYPPALQLYQLTMLARRLELPLPDALQQIRDAEPTDLESHLELLAGTPAMRERALLRQAAPRRPGRVADQPIPDPPAWQPPELDDVDAPPELEAMAGRVPPECFYIRYGSFANFLWFRDLSMLYGGDIAGMFRATGFRDSGMQRVETQLGMKLTEMSRMLGPTLIEDQALIGNDLFLASGASIGTLIKAKNRFLLETSFRNDRGQLASREDDVTLKNVTIADRTVSLLSSPDHRVRSFLAMEGPWIFLTNSRHLVERFYAVADGAPSLADQAEFRWARTAVPLEREDTVFAYFSSKMLQELFSPRTQIELRRRLASQADRMLLTMARQAAKHEGRRLPTIEALVAEGFLPRGFGLRPDGSGLVSMGPDEPRRIDSKRGRFGSFLPIPDVPFGKVTADEAAWYRERADHFFQRWPQIDPIMIAVARQATEAGPETLSIRAQLAPMIPEKYSWITQQLGPPTKTAFQFAEDDIVTAQAHVVSDRLQGTIPPHHLFVAIKDSQPPQPEELDGILRTYVALQSLPGYLGAWPQPGLLDRLPLGIGKGAPISENISRLLGGVYRYQGGGFSVLSFQLDILTQSLTALVATTAEEEAQVRLHVGDLANSQLRGWVRERTYRQAAATSQAIANFLQQIDSAWDLPPKEVLSQAGDLLSVSLVCPLGGAFERRQTAAGSTWVSTAWGEQPVAPETPPADYRAPLLRWFRGLDGRLTQQDRRVVIEAEVRTEHEPQPGRRLPQPPKAKPQRQSF